MTKRPHTNYDKKTPKPVSREVDPAEVWAAATNEKAARAMAAWLKGSVHLSRIIGSLTLGEMQALASTANHVWIVEASRRRSVEPDPAQREKLQNLLS